ncbi:YqkE family protein [Paenibacillus sp. GCM10027626]|uniref:YqkE family protein n=1 Tax=Paenibacillus sp. GCM10027626 TaxID=3273411 RepID=UPI00362C38D1
MAKAKKRQSTAARNDQRPSSSAAQGADKPATLKDLLRPDLVEKLKAHSSELKAADEQRKEQERQQIEAARKAEQKRLENDFEHLLNNSRMDWRQHK